MIDLITGLPGNSKTLFTIAWVRDWAKRDNRQVFYSGIPLSDDGKAALGWIEIEPEKWMEAPPNSIVIIDECQRIFRSRSLGSQPPKHVSELETHRHLGIDLVFITQHPSLIDPAIRRLTGRHRHLVRIWGLEASTVHEWPAVRDNCDKPVARKDSQKLKWKFDKSVYKLYKSAEVHTVKKNIPMRLWLVLAVPPVLVLAFWLVYQIMFKDKLDAAKKTQQQPAQVGQLAPGQGGAPGVNNAKPVFDPLADARNYVAMNTPRVTGLQHTAPKYDELTKPTAVPVPAACMHTMDRCQCYSQQATRLDVPFNMCVEIARNGYFEDFNPNGNQQPEDRQRTARSVQVLDNQERLPISGASTRDRAPGANLADGYGVNGKAGPGVRVPAS